MGNTDTMETPSSPVTVLKCLVCKKIACFAEPISRKVFCGSKQCYIESLALLNE